MKRVLLLCGGQSPEHEISLRSCKNVLNAINRSKYEVTVVGISQDGHWVLLDETELPSRIDQHEPAITVQPGEKTPFWSQGKTLGSFDVIFPVLHGPNGEDGTVQGMMQLLGIPFVGCGVLSSAISMDKDTSKRLLKAADVGVAEWVCLTDTGAIPSFDEIKQQLSSTVFVKPSNMGSSVGVHRVTNEEEWERAVEDAFKYDARVLVEVGVVGRELECAVLGNQSPKASGVGEVSAGEFYSYEEKYEDTSTTELSIPANVTAEELERLKVTAVKAYQVLHCEGLTRVDMFLTPEGEIIVNEVNTMPGFTSISMYPKLWEHEGIPYADLIDELISLALQK